MAEKVRGSFVFTILDKRNSIYFVRGENPLSIFCYGGFYLYASTAEILLNAERKLGLQHYDEIKTEEGDILKIDRNGKCSWGYFQSVDLWGGWRSCYPCCWDKLEDDMPPAVTI